MSEERVKMSAADRFQAKQELIAQIKAVQAEIILAPNRIPRRVMDGDALEVQRWRDSAERAYYRRIPVASHAKSINGLQELLEEEKCLLTSLT